MMSSITSCITQLIVPLLQVDGHFQNICL